MSSINPEPGQLYSLWWRQSTRKKWKLIYDFVFLLKIEKISLTGEQSSRTNIIFQTSETLAYNRSPASVYLENSDGIPFYKLDNSIFIKPTE